MALSLPLSSSATSERWVRGVSSRYAHSRRSGWRSGWNRHGEVRGFRSSCDVGKVWVSSRVLGVGGCLPSVYCLGDGVRGFVDAYSESSVRLVNSSMRCEFSAGEATSSAGEFEVADVGDCDTVTPVEESHGLLGSSAESGSDLKMGVLSESASRFFSLGDYCKRFCSDSPTLWRKVPAGLLCSCALVVPGLASPVAAAEALPAMDFVAAAITLGGALGILGFFDALAKRDVLDKKLSRKLVHILSGLVFMLCWPLFSSAPLAKYLAAFAPAANGLRMIGLGLGLWQNEALVKAMCREDNNRRELLKGPLALAITITIVTVCFWRTSPVGAVAVANLCAGDGFADIVGRRYGTHKLPYNRSKSYMGSIAFFVLASLFSVGYVAYFSAFGYFTAPANIYLATLGVSLASAIVESLPLPIDDNYTVPFTAIGVGMLLLPF